MKKSLLFIVFLIFAISSCEDVDKKPISKKNNAYSLLKSNPHMLKLFQSYVTSTDYTVATKGSTNSYHFNIETAVILELGNDNKLILAEPVGSKDEYVCFYYSGGTENIVFNLSNKDKSNKENIQTRASNPDEDCYREMLAKIKEAQDENMFVDIGIDILESIPIMGEATIKLCIWRACMYERRHEAR